MKFFRKIIMGMLLTGTIVITSAVTPLNCLSVNAATSSVVSQNGQLSVKKGTLCNQNGTPVQLKGMSYFWHCWDPGLYNPSSVSELVSHWNVSVIRIPMGIDVSGGYLSDPDGATRKVCTMVDAAISQGIYVIIDWHEEKATTHQAQAEDFFRKMAKKYGNNPNVIYEIYNEPTSTSWSSIKSYAQGVIKAIREYDADNIIIVGTPNWSQNVDEAANDPINESNIMYTLHFYAGTHKQWLRDKMTYALNKGLAIFVTEWGTCDASGNTNLDTSESDLWLSYLDLHNISWCNWSLNTKAETASALNQNASMTGPWSNSDLTDSGKYVKAKLESKTVSPVIQPTASDIESGSTYEIVNVNSSLALDAGGSYDGANVQQWSYGGGNNQKWIITDQGNGRYEISGVESGKALDAGGSSDGANIQIWSYGGGNNQLWYFNNLGNNRFRIIGAESGKALDVCGWSKDNGGNVDLWYYKDGNNQKWTLVKVN